MLDELMATSRGAYQALVEAPEVRVIAFTGSTAAGRKVGETAARLGGTKKR